MVTYAELYRDVRAALLENEGVNASQTARELLCAASGLAAADILAGRELAADEQAVRRVREFVRRRLAGEPLAYILGEWDFCGMTLTVTQDVLIPRDDTMAVTELAMKKALFLEQNPRILDLCAGTGCIGLAIARRVKDARVTLGELSPGAIRVAKRNIADQKLSGRVSCISVDVRKPAARFLGTFDMIVSNPPYVTTAEMAELDPSVRDFEPQMALHGGADGLDFYRVIVKNFLPALRPGGYVCFEFGMGQHEAVSAILEAAGCAVLQTRQDTGGIIRAVLAQYKREEA
ncbi:MAG: peptide chain release factor N(5)-glutamine methyltransferase [Oscillospiraceae bacterium]|nr:peptide chain release factor N(5)-glutamine methyltransferase [Oscillospiraceae bacterium]